MINKRVRTWNSKLASRIDSHQTTAWDRMVFRKMLAQNELDERQLRMMYRRWRLQGTAKSFCEFLADTGWLTIELQATTPLGCLESDPERENILVSLTSQLRLEFARLSNFRERFTLLVMILRTVFQLIISTREGQLSHRPNNMPLN